MKGKTMVIGIIVFVLLVVGAVSWAMLSTINKIKEENEMNEEAVMLIEQDEISSFLTIK